ncbi:MAG TPA: phospholipase [Rhodospirillaceae bacterium]|nr:MAG: phospholipase [Alphaproteobacteria bacterium GWF2_58_20]HAU29253.1 phospholipase [Rhodospirillaceae bacterium]
MTQSHILQGPSAPPLSGGKARQLVILMHGLGADGADLLSLATHWAQMLPHAAFLAPNGIEECDMAPYGYQWFSLQDRSPEHLLAGVRRAELVVGAYIDHQLALHGLSDEHLALVGFSQGGMMALHLGLHRLHTCAGVVSFSGLLVGGLDLPATIKSRPPALLLHGSEDDVVPVQNLGNAMQALKAAGVFATGITRPNLGHAIDMEGIVRAGAFLKKAFGEG